MVGQVASNNAAASAANATFDPYSQVLVILAPDGSTQFSFGIDRMFQLQMLATTTAIIYGVQIGICALLLLVLIMMTKAEKRRSIIFIFNFAALLFLFIRGIAMCLELTGPFYNFYNFITGWYINVNNALAQSVTAEISSFMALAAIELSMLFQTRVVCCTLQAFYRHIVTIACIFVAFTTITVRLTCLVINIIWGILLMNEMTNKRQLLISHLSSAYNVCTIVSIIFFSTIFCVKLGHAIHRRHTLGMKQFGPMQMIFVMGCQTLFIPVIFGIVSYWALRGSQLYSLMPVVVATFLPLSSIWASTNTAANVNIAAPKQWQEQVAPPLTHDKSLRSDRELLSSTINTADTLVGEPHNASVSSAKPKRMGHHASASHERIDLEMAKDRIQVDRSYSVRSD